MALVEEALERAVALSLRANPGPALGPLLAELLAAWQATRAPTLAALIDDVGGELSRHQESVVARRKAWLRALSLPARFDVDSLGLPLLTMSPLVMIELAAALAAARPDDPRVASLLVRCLPTARHHPEQLPHLLRALEKIADPRSVASLTELVRRPDWPNWQLVDVARTVAERASTFTPPSPIAELQIARIADARRDRLHERQRLLAPIYADPDDDAARLVFGDWALERGDPWGELIALQFRAQRGRISDEEHRRITRLGRLHHRAFTGDLWPFLTVDTFERGFPESGTINGREPSAAPYLGRPEWSTLRRLRQGGLEEQQLIAVLSDPALRSLREVDAVGGNVIAALERAGRPLPFEKIGIAYPATSSALGGLRCLPHLRELVVYAPAPWLLESDIVPRLDTLQIQLNYFAPAQRAPLVAALLDRPPRHLRCSDQLTLHFDEGGPTADLSTPLGAGRGDVILLAGLPANAFRRLRLDAPLSDAQRADLRARLARHTDLEIL